MDKLRKILITSIVSLTILSSCDDSPIDSASSDGTTLPTSDTNSSTNTETSITDSVSSSTSNSTTNTDTAATSGSLSSTNVDEGEVDKPIFDSNTKTIKFGYYPQKVVDDENLIASLNNIGSNDNSWINYEGINYTKIVANVVNGEKNYNFSNNKIINSGEEYWFSCDAISWKVLSINNKEYYAITENILDCSYFYDSYEVRNINGKEINPNNYENSKIRSYSNNEIFSLAFSNNSSYFISDSLNDKISLPSKDNLINKDFGFDNDSSTGSNTRCAKASDFALAKGTWKSKDNSNSTYWTKNASEDYNYAAIVSNSGGYLSSYSVTTSSHGIRLVATIKID